MKTMFAKSASLTHMPRVFSFRLLACLAGFLLMFMAAPSRAAVVYSGVQNVTIPLTGIDGVYLNVSSGSSTTTYPGDTAWDAAPWFNPFAGGVAIWTSALLRPVVTTGAQVVNVEYNALINSAQNFASGENVSSTHVGGSADQFALGTEGYIGFAFQPSVGGPTYYGWARLTISNSTNGVIKDWAYDDSSAPIFAGTLATAPEPGRALLLGAGMLGMVMRRRRR